jgi:hypothetical protein
MVRCISPSMVPKSLCKEKAGSVDISGSNAGERLPDSKAALPANFNPVVFLRHACMYVANHPKYWTRSAQRAALNDLDRCYYSAAMEGL